jgi:hypothetical protein
VRKQFLVAALAALCALALADSSGPRSGTGAGSGWGTPANVATSDNTYATYTVPAQTPSAPLYISSLGFTVPTGATVNGIVVTFERRCTNSTACNLDAAYGGGIALTKTAGVAVASKSDAAAWPNGDTTVTYGSNADLWGTTWSVSEVNTSGFGALLTVYNNSMSARTASVDYLAVTVYYTLGATTPSPGRRAVYSQTRSLPLPPVRAKKDHRA